jgi:rhamnosyltransferase
MSADFPKVAVLLAAYNGMSWIEEQLASILAQTDVRVSVYISVDPSTDGTDAWCADYASSHSSVHLLPPSGPFKGAARNFFRLVRDVDFSAYDYVSFADQDDVWYPDKLQRAVARLRSDGVDGYSSNVIAFWPDGRRMLVDKAQPQVKWDYLFEAAGPGCTYVLTRELASAFKRSVTTRWDDVQNVALHDWFCYAFARSHGYKWFIDPVAGMDYRQHASNQFGVNAGAASAVTRVKQLADGWWISQVRLICALTDGNGAAVSERPELAGRMAFVRLAMLMRDCRRRQRDQLAFVAICLVMAVYNPTG